MQVRDGNGAYKLLGTRRVRNSLGDGHDVDLHRHGEGDDAVTHEHPLGAGHHRHGEAANHRPGAAWEKR
mgnify:CR=1 FL=1